MGCHFLPHGIFPPQGLNSRISVCCIAGIFFIAEPPGKPLPSSYSRLILYLPFPYLKPWALNRTTRGKLLYRAEKLCFFFNDYQALLQCVFFFKQCFISFLFLAVPCCMKDLSSPTRAEPVPPALGAQSTPLGHQGNPGSCVLIWHEFHKREEQILLASAQNSISVETELAGLL